MTSSRPSWRALYERRLQMRQRYKSVWQIPLQRRALDVIRRHVRERDRVLDVGGSAKFWERRREKLPALDVKTLNIDPEEQCDYRSLDEVDGEFDVVLMTEMIEHVPAEEGMKLLRDVRPHLKPGGKIIITTPNIQHPSRFWDTTHVTPWRYDELGAALMAAGYDVVEVWRLYNAGALDRWFRRAIGVWLHRYLDIDFALSIAIVAAAAAAEQDT